MSYAKAIVGFAGAVALLLSDTLADDLVGRDEIQNVAVGILTAIFVYFVPNKQETP